MLSSIKSCVSSKSYDTEDAMDNDTIMENKQKSAPKKSLFNKNRNKNIHW